MNFFNIEWGAIEYIWYFPVLLILLCVLVYRVYKTRVVANILAVLRSKTSMLKNSSLTRHVIKVILLAVGGIFLFLALLHPRWDKKEEIIAQEGRDLFIALDVSRSMLAQDYTPNRLDFAKAKIKALLQQLSCERVGLILFSGATTVQCPLTSDYSAFYMFLDQVDVETISSGTTALDNAIKKALQAFSKMPERKHKLLVLMTDGEDFSRNLSSVKREVQKNNMSIFALGVGSPDGAPIPLVNERGNKRGHLKDEKGAVVISRLNEQLLHSLASESGGTYLRATNDDTDVRQLLRFVEQFEKEKIEDKKLSVLEEQYPYFIAVSLCCFALEWLL